MAQGGKSRPEKIQAQSFGALWLANFVEKEINLAGLIDEVVEAKKEKDTTPTVGEYFLYAVYNRMIQACSKRAMPGWYKPTAIQHIRPVRIDELNSQMYWLKWDQVGKQQLEKITKKFLQRISELEPSSSDCFMFDTTNYYTFMASDTESDLARRGKSKEGRNWLRQVGIALLVSRDKRIPLYYREYEGNRHGSKVFLQVMEGMFMAMRKSAGADATLTVVFDKGMNSEENIGAIDEPVDLMYFRPIFSLYEKFYPRNINYMPVVKFFVCLDLERKSY